MKVLIEACIASLEDAIAAADAGADRLELNQALELGGLTPSAALVAQVVEAVEIPVVVMVRPRAAGFCYSLSERGIILDDARRFAEMGVEGVACGVLTESREIDFKFWGELIKRTPDLEIVFHRAFDIAGAHEDDFKRLVDMGTARILTSGGASTAMEGLEKLRTLHKLWPDRDLVLPASGISPQNAVQHVTESGCRQIHGSFSCTATDVGEPVAPNTYPKLSGQRIRETRQRLAEGL